MAPQAHFLSEGDRNAIKDGLDTLKRLAPRPGAAPHSDTVTAPEVYVARTPVGGIPGLVRGTGTPEIRTGRAGRQFYVSRGDEPGGEYCNVYRIQQDGTDWQLRPVAELYVWVWNLKTEPIPENQWLIITRDKFGEWWALELVGGEGGGFWGYLINVDCTQGLMYVVEVEPIPGFTWQGRDGGVQDYCKHVDWAISYPSGGPLVADGTIRWIRRGHAGPPQEYLFDGPVGWTGTHSYSGRVECVGPTGSRRLYVLPYYKTYHNGQLVKQPCHEPSVPVCAPCPPDPPPPT